MTAEGKNQMDGFGSKVEEIPPKGERRKGQNAANQPERKNRKLGPKAQYLDDRGSARRKGRDMVQKWGPIEPPTMGESRARWW